MALKLVVSDTLAFTARFIFKDEGKDRIFAARLEAQRCRGRELDSEIQAHPVFSNFLRSRGLRLVAWDGESPLVDEAGAPAPASPEALEALLAESGMPNVLFAAYLEANGAKAKLGN